MGEGRKEIIPAVDSSVESYKCTFLFGIEVCPCNEAEAEVRNKSRHNHNSPGHPFYLVFSEMKAP
jgi:hypothetical protein